MTTDSARREEILETAAAMFASSGLRTSLREIAARCGILPGSLYHHFDSKEAIIVELVRRYRDELDQVAKDACDALHEPDQRPVEERVIELGRAIAACAVRHRAALLLTLYEPPTGAGDELVDLARQAPTAIDAAMSEILQAGRTAGALRSGIDLGLLGERICQSMLHVGVGVFHRSHAQQLPAQKCRVLLHGLAVKVPSKAALDRSAAMQAARTVISGWDAPEDDDRVARLRAVARREFGRRGFEVTTMRDVAKAAGMSTGTVYRMFGSKDDLLIDIMQAYSENVAAAWDEVARSSSPPLEQLDALMWLNINVLTRFSEEFKINLAWLRQSPPNSVDLGVPFGRQLRQLQDLLAAGERAGELRVEGGSLLARTRSLYELILTPENVILHAGPRAAHTLARDTVLRGAMVRG
jgi:AcrR family transcriptional regulator